MIGAERSNTSGHGEGQTGQLHFPVRPTSPPQRPLHEDSPQDKATEETGAEGR